MDETALRGLAEQLLRELPERIPDAAERAPVANAITAAVNTRDGEARKTLLNALPAHEATRAWLRERVDEDVVRRFRYVPDESTTPLQMHVFTTDGPERVRGGMLGDPTTPIGLYYVCPEEDEDLILFSVPAVLPLCSKHGVAMTLQD